MTYKGRKGLALHGEIQKFYGDCRKGIEMLFCRGFLYRRI